MTDNIPFLVAHRGFYKCKYPENSITALRAALEAGAPFVEIDIQMTNDHQFVVIHDKTFERTASVGGEVNKTTFKHCMETSVHQPDKYGTKFYPEMMPSLQDVMDLMVQYPEAKLLLEIKSSSLTAFGDDIYFEKLLPYLNKYEDQIVVISFCKRAISHVREMTACKTAWIFTKWDDSTKQVADELKPDILMCTNNLIPDNDPIWPGYEFMVYGLTDPELILHYGLQGIKYIEVDDIERFYKNEELVQKATSHRIKKERNAEIMDFMDKIPEGLRNDDFTCNAAEFAQIVGAQPKDVSAWIRQEQMPATPQGKGFAIDIEEAIAWCLDAKKFDLSSAGEAVSLNQEKLKQQVKNLKLGGEKAKLAVESAQLRLLVERERYVDIELVKEQIDASMKEVISSLRAVGQQIALKLVSVSDRGKIQAIIDKRVEEVLDDLKRALSE